MVTDKELLKQYMKGFNDELRGTSSIESDNELENKAYRIGALDAIVGDDLSSVDLKTNEEVIRQIRSDD
jgi:hypothetical protein